MRLLKFTFLICLIACATIACSSRLSKSNLKKEQAVRIANNSLEYEIVIIDPGFNGFLNSFPRPESYYTQRYLETWNRIYVANWNMRFQNPTQFNSEIYQNFIDYEPNINYGKEVNYKLFTYFQFAQKKYRINLENGPLTSVRIR